MLSLAAFNALLKPLEDTPKHIIFILVTTQKNKIIPTVLSRCQIYEFKKIDNNNIIKYLKYISNKENIDIDEYSLNLIAEKSEGSLRDSLNYLDQLSILYNK